ncbi:MAG: urease accessory protein UreD [Rhodobacteraceae bacterium]|nr:urease accessory protein UreD [Paracoccaceae bacterium]
MLDAPPMPTPPEMLQRSRGAVRVVMGHDGARPRLRRLHQSGCAKLFLPRVFDAPPEAVFVNTAGGLTGGDRLELAAEAEAGAHLVCSSQAAERVYASSPGTSPARVDIALRLGAGARLEWLPNETILFDNSSLDRRMEVDMPACATMLMAEMLILGRGAMGERRITARLRDRREIRRAGRVVHLEAIRADLPLSDRPGSACLGPARAQAAVILVSPDAEARLDAVRAALPPSGGPVEAAASAWEGRLVARLLSHDPAMLRRAVTVLLCALRTDPLPRVWYL